MISHRRFFRIGLVLGLFILLTACGTSNPLAVPTESPFPPTPIPLPSLTPTPIPNSIAGFEQFLVLAEGLKPGQRQDMANRFVAQLNEAPITSMERAVFLWLGAAQTVQLVGDMNNWNIDTAPALTRLDGSDLWYLSIELETDARLDYQFLIDGDGWELDPLNSSTIMTSSGPNSVLNMPGYETPPELAPIETDIPRGTITTHTLDSNSLNQTRTFFVYEPAGQLVGRNLPSIFINNGSDYLNLINTPAILDQLIAQRLIPPLVAVFIPPLSPAQEYVFNDAYVGFLADELVPFVQQNYNTDPDEAATGIMGAALGGLAAAYTADTRPDVFGLVAGQSSDFSANNDAIIRQISRKNSGQVSRFPVRYYLIAGTYETAIRDNGRVVNLLEANRRMAEALETASYDVRFDEQPEGHSWGLWQGTFGQALSFLFN